MGRRGGWEGREENNVYQVGVFVSVTGEHAYQVVVYIVVHNRQYSQHIRSKSPALRTTLMHCDITLAPVLPSNVLLLSLSPSILRTLELMLRLLLLPWLSPVSSLLVRLELFLARWNDHSTNDVPCDSGEKQSIASPATLTPAYGNCPSPTTRPTARPTIINRPTARSTARLVAGGTIRRSFSPWRHQQHRR